MRRQSPGPAMNQAGHALPTNISFFNGLDRVAQSLSAWLGNGHGLLSQDLTLPRFAVLFDKGSRRPGEMRETIVLGGIERSRPSKALRCGTL